MKSKMKSVLILILILLSCKEIFAGSMQYYPEQNQEDLAKIFNPDQQNLNFEQENIQDFHEQENMEGPYIGQENLDGSLQFGQKYIPSDNQYSQRPSYNKLMYSGHPKQDPPHLRNNENIGKYSYTQEPSYNEGCGPLPLLKNSKAVCSLNKCRMTCIDGYQFPSRHAVQGIRCDDGEWVAIGWPTLADCEPICIPDCQNSGICVAPDECDCPDNFNGPQCQFEKKPCMNNPPLPKNSKRICSSNICTIVCAKGYRFSDMSSTQTLTCKEGDWVPANPGVSVIADCEPVCNPPCLNGGLCLSANYCQCPQKFRGPQCEYPIEVCAASKLGFNGGYNCSGHSEGFSCSISCPTGVKFSSPPAPSYTCLYATGKFEPQPVPQCVYGVNSVVEFGPVKSQHSSLKKSLNPDRSSLGSSKTSSSNFLLNESKLNLPKSGICFTWGGAHYKTFDGKVYSYNSNCRQILVRDAKDSTFNIAIENIQIGRRIIIFLKDKEYTLEPTHNGGVMLKSSKRLLPIPAQLSGFRVEMAGHMIQVSLEMLGVKLKWDKYFFVEIEVSEVLWNKTEGLCGNIDGNIDNDVMTKDGFIPKTMMTLFNSWQMKNINDDLCENSAAEQHACKSQDKYIAEEAHTFCSNLLSKHVFKSCSHIMDISLLFESCKWDYCGCVHNIPRETCGCDSLAVYAKQCVAQGVQSLKSWRDDNTCKMECTGGTIYQSCGPPIQISCGSAASILNENVTTSKSICIEGCFCPPGTYMNNGTCVTKEQCPCRFRGKDYPPGSSVPKECNTCTCQNGEWICTQTACGARCSSIGDPHYQTFDGKKYNFMGKCSYTLLKGANFSINAENIACSGAISEAMNLASSVDLSVTPSCTKSIIIKSPDSSIVLKQGKLVVINGKDFTRLPIKHRGIKISVVSSLFIKVEMPGGVEIWWDGMTRAHIDVPGSYIGKTKGLCGTYNLNQKDDFLTPEGDVEQSIVPFANKWKTKEICEDLVSNVKSHPCDLNPHNKLVAEKMCKILKSSLFEECHWNVDVESYYEDCLYDMCSCDTAVDKCLCPIIGGYASECSRLGVQIEWRYHVKECEIHCTGGQIYQVCGDSCARSCYDLSGGHEDFADAAEEARCRPKCIEGCNCPGGQTLDNNGECIPIGSCPCWYAGMEFPSQYKEVRPGRKEPELCTCLGANWNCRPATKNETTFYPRAIDIKDRCSAANHEEFVTCEPIKPVTCKNMHQPPSKRSPVECRPGCKCKKGYVLDMFTKKCIKPDECPCHHGGKSYQDGHKMQEECNTCLCNNGKWNCEKRQCAGVCSSWGDSHFKTFDGRRYDFQGICAYLLVKGSADEDSFSVEMQNEVCGSSGVTCSKSITLKVGSVPKLEIVTLTKNKHLPSSISLKKIKIRSAGLFTIVEIEHLGVSLHWDKGTRLYIKVNPSWKGRLKGLCGNYNDNEADDFQTPSGGIAEASSLLFGDSWKLDPHCAPSQETVDTCRAHPERQSWAAHKCGVLKEYPFSACHSEIAPDEFQQRCERDTCACNMGGDCECLCTALAAYAFECASRGVPIKWRTQELCPMQCDETCTNYSPCVSTCPLETCDNTMVYSQISTMCHKDTCIEGCEKKDKCHSNEIYKNDSTTECILKTQCKPSCMKLDDGREILEGDVIEQDECHTCHCSRGSKICNGQPCTTVIPKTTTEQVNLMHQKVTCKTGWTPWINNIKPDSVKSNTKSSKPYSVETESIPSVVQLSNLNEAYCDIKQMVDIECRTTSKHISAKETGLNAECSLEKGLFCRQPQANPCPDFEIRLKCQCESVTSEAPHEYVCDDFTTSFPHPTDCSKYYECSPETDDKVLRTCPPLTLFDATTLICDWAQKVIENNPRCSPGKTTPPTTVTHYQTLKEKLLKYVEQTTPIPRLGRPKAVELCNDPLRPNYPHPDDCAMFFHCAPLMGPPEHPNMVLKTCGPNMLYNPQHMICDWPQNVIPLRPMCGDLEETTHSTVGTSISLYENVEDIGNCTFEKVWSDCAVDCQKLCLFYHYYFKRQQKCDRNEKCIPGCVDRNIAQLKCGKDEYWRDAKTCVKINQCTCYSHTGKPVKPGEVVKESRCEICQCINNQYVCDKSSCRKENLEAVQFSEDSNEEDKDDESRSLLYGSVHITSTISPPPECDPDRYTNVLWNDQPMSDEAFSASSVVSSSFKPQFAILNGNVTDMSGGSWIPAETDTLKYLQVKLKRKEPIYGIWMQGSPLFDYFVTSYKIMYSQNGHHFDDVKNNDNSPQIFKGPIDSKTPKKEMFDIPIEAQYIKIHPLNWHNEVAIRFELIGCSVVSTTAAITEEFYTEGTTTTPRPRGSSGQLARQRMRGRPRPVCLEPMGVDNGLLISDYITVSSEHPDYTTEYLGLTKENAWQPLTSSPEEWIQFDFTGMRNLSGIRTKGGPHGWVSAYTIKYSSDGNHWNPILNENKEEKIFSANYDKTSEITNLFEKPIHAQFLKIIPKKWKDVIEMKIEPLGCYSPYEAMTTEMSKLDNEVSVEEECDVCKGIEVPVNGCTCQKKLLFNGFECVPQTECPCIVGHMSYAVGTSYKTEKCQECVCKLGGVPLCVDQKCPACKPGSVASFTSNCMCDCVPCSEGKRICPTSQTCVNESSWCDGIIDCPDDEINCLKITETTTTAVETLIDSENVAPKNVCAIPTCPDKYKVVMKKPNERFELKNEDVTSDSLFAKPMVSPRKSYMKYYKGGPAKGGTVTDKSQNQQEVASSTSDIKKFATKPKIEEEICPKWRCVSSRPPPSLRSRKKSKKILQAPCPVPKCPSEYILKLENDKLDEYDCPKYACVPPPRRDVVCNATSRTFNTFDGTEYQYDVCNHILARDTENNMWDVTVQKNCTKNICVHELLISQKTDKVRLLPDLTVEYNGYYYTIDQTRKIGLQTNTFAISKLGNTLFYISTDNGFWVIYDGNSNIKIGVAGKLYGRVDGLCGYYNGKADDDRRKPDGTQSISTEEFGDSWALNDSPIDCDIRTCPINLQNEAWKICESVEHQVFNSCSSIMDLKHSRARCLEDVCNCLQSNDEQESKSNTNLMQSDEERCLCKALQTLVTECMAADPSINLHGWRTAMNCPAYCNDNLVHYDCYRRSCEPCCDTMQDDNVCPVTPGVCFSGCFCPEGLVRKENQCVLPSSCRDCVCDGFGKPQYMTFDQQNFTFDGKCTYTVVKEKYFDEKNSFGIYVGYGNCPVDKNSTCTKYIYIIYAQNVINITQKNNNLITEINKIPVLHYPHVNDWIKLQLILENDISLVIPKLQLEMNIFKKNMAFNIKLPSKLYGGKVTGLCGDCDGDDSNDIGPSKDPIVFAKEMRAPEPVLKQLNIEKTACFEKPKNVCRPITPSRDPCLKLLNDTNFEKCRPIINPSSYVTSCQQDSCSENKTVDVCSYLEAYARECRRAGICVDWRRKDLCPYNCAKHLDYKPCGLGCQTTCQNYKEFSKNPSACTEPMAEGCYCKNNQILKNGVCIEHKKCFPCDSDNHYVGDKWRRDACTECTCSEKGEAMCVKQTCSQGISCLPGYESKEVAKPQGQCCPEYVCVAQAMEKPETCEEPIKLVCGYGQKLTLETAAGKCPQFICKCKPSEECDSISADDAEILEPGMEKVINSSGCCPKIEYVCKEESCPSKPQCRTFYNLKSKKKERDCCPTYICEPPKDKCIHQVEYESSPLGGEVKKIYAEVVQKSVDTKWDDGPCRTCVCKKTGIDVDSKMQAVCSIKQCPKQITSDDYEIKYVAITNKCCLKPKYIACKYKDILYNAGDTWTSDENSCESYTCIEKEDGTLEKQKTVTQCETNCKKGFKYVPSSNEKNTCCGDCVPSSCVWRDNEYTIGKHWSSDDNCVGYKCINRNGTTEIQSKVTVCPEITETMRDNYQLEEIPVEGHCCKKVIPVACKDNEETYKEGSTWKSADENPCKNITCIKNSEGDLQKVDSYENCNADCADGWEYELSNDQKVCCGQCVQKNCIVGKTLYKPGQKWYSIDNCTQFSCNKQSNQLVIVTSQESCPDVSNCDKKNIYMKGCCQHCNITSLSQSTCVAEDMPLQDTVGLVWQTKQSPFGFCVNKQPIRGFKYCKGSCLSGTSYNNETKIYDVTCTCCKPVKNEQIMVNTICQNGYSLKMKITMPAVCECSECSEAQVAAQYIKTGGTKTANVKSGRPRASFAEKDLNDEVELIDPNNVDSS